MRERSTQVQGWGQVEGAPVQLFSLVNGRGWTLRLCEYGASVVSLTVPDRHGALADVVLGYDDLAGYQAGNCTFGAVVGRCANRIAGAAFELDGQSYELAANDGRQHLHGGRAGFDKQVWQGQVEARAEGPAVSFQLHSAAGQEGYPGALDVTVTYVLSHSGELRVEMRATSDAPTLCNLAQHAYWNLAGHDSGPVLGHLLQSSAQRYLPVDAERIPTGQVASVAGTPFDFRSEKSLGHALAQVGGEPQGYDHNLVLADRVGALRPVARVRHPGSGRTLAVLSNQPGVQLYTGNFLDDEPGKACARYLQHGGFCLETQAWPDAIHHADWPSPVLAPGQTYQHTLLLRFGTD